MGAPVVYVVDDDDSFRESLEGFLRSVGFEVHAFASPREFLAQRTLAGASYLLLDVTLPGMSGPEFQRELARRGVTTPIVFLSGHEDEAVRREVLAGGALACFSKPFDEDELLAVVRLDA